VAASGCALPGRLAGAELAGAELAGAELAGAELAGAAWMSAGACRHSRKAAAPRGMGGR
jgi:uncharacterized protein YjbI with pentapeptide repeats